MKALACDSGGVTMRAAGLFKTRICGQVMAWCSKPATILFARPCAKGIALFARQVTPDGCSVPCETEGTYQVLVVGEETPDEPEPTEAVPTEDEIADIIARCRKFGVTPSRQLAHNLVLELKRLLTPDSRPGVERAYLLKRLSEDYDDDY